MDIGRNVLDEVSIEDQGGPDRARVDSAREEQLRR